MSRFAVVGCSNCSQHWVIEDSVSNSTASQHECPRCGYQHSDDQLRRRARADTWENAVEQRSVLLAITRNASAEFNEISRYADLEDELDRDLVGQPLGVQVLTGAFSDDQHLDTAEREAPDKSDHSARQLGDLRCHEDAGLWMVQQYPAVSSGTVRLDEESRPGELWQRLVGALGADIALAVRELVGGVADGAAWQTLESIIDDQLGAVDQAAFPDPASLNGSIVASTLLSLCKDVESEQHQQALELLESFGSAEFGPLGIAI